MYSSYMLSGKKLVTLNQAADGRCGKDRAAEKKTNNRNSEKSEVGDIIVR